MSNVEIEFGASDGFVRLYATAVGVVERVRLRVRLERVHPRPVGGELHPPTEIDAEIETGAVWVDLNELRDDLATMLASPDRPGQIGVGESQEQGQFGLDVRLAHDKGSIFGWVSDSSWSFDSLTSGDGRPFQLMRIVPVPLGSPGGRLEFNWTTDRSYLAATARQVNAALEKYPPFRYRLYSRDGEELGELVTYNTHNWNVGDRGVTQTPDWLWFRVLRTEPAPDGSPYTAHFVVEPLDT